MATPLILVVMLIYGAIGTRYALLGNAPMSIVWFGYCASNIGLAWLAWKDGA
jgi:hypothetical protein